MNNSLCGRRTFLVAKIHLIPLTFIEHLLCSEANTSNPYKRYHPMLKWPCYECFIFLKSVIFWVTVLASHHFNTINSFIVLDWFNYLLCRVVYLSCVSITRVLHISAYCRIIQGFDADAASSGLPRGKNFSVIEYFGAGMQQLDFFFFLTWSSTSFFLLLSRETVRCESCILSYPVVSVCVFYFSIEGTAFPSRNKYF